MRGPRARVTTLRPTHGQGGFSLNVLHCCAQIFSADAGDFVCPPSTFSSFPTRQIPHYFLRRHRVSPTMTRPPAAPAYSLSLADGAATACVGPVARALVEFYGDEAVGAIFACSPQVGWKLVQFHACGDLDRFPRPSGLLAVIAQPRHGNDVALWAMQHHEESAGRGQLGRLSGQPAGVRAGPQAACGRGRRGAGTPRKSGAR